MEGGEEDSLPLCLILLGVVRKLLLVAPQGIYMPDDDLSGVSINAEPANRPELALPTSPANSSPRRLAIMRAVPGVGGGGRGYCLRQHFFPCRYGTTTLWTCARQPPG